MNEDIGGVVRRVTRAVGFLAIVVTLCAAVFRLSGDVQSLVVGALLGALGTMVVFYFPKDHEK